MNYLVKPMIVLNLLFIAIFTSVLIPYKSVDKELNPYYNRAMEIIHANCNEGEYDSPNQIVVKFGKMANEEAMAQCLYVGVMYTISVKKSTWDRLTEDQKYSTMFHEVAHCALGLDHSPDPYHYMYYMDQELPYETVLAQYTNDVMVSCSQNRRHR